MRLKEAIVMAVAIARIADDWVMKMCTVATDLMLPTRYWHRAHERIPRGFISSHGVWQFNRAFAVKIGDGIDGFRRIGGTIGVVNSSFVWQVSAHHG